MHQRLNRLEHIHEVEAAIAESATRPVIIFKHSRSCGTSAQALDEINEHLDNSRADVWYGIVTVQTHRDVSNHIASRLGIRHETPQALLVKDGRVVWQASHFRVTASAMDAALDGQPAGVR